MRRLLLLGLGVALVWRFLRGRHGAAESVTVGWADGSSITLGPDAAERDRMLAAAHEVLGP